MALCASCGHGIEPGARFCFACGQQVVPGSNAPAPAIDVDPMPGYTSSPVLATGVAFSENKGRSMLVYATLALVALVMVAFIPRITTQIDQLDRVQDFAAGSGTRTEARSLLDEVQRNDEAIETMNGLLAFSLLVAGVAFLFWVHRAYKNLLALNVRNLPSTPSFAVWSFIIPFVSFVLPYVRTAEIWKASGPEGANSKVTGVNWKFVSVPLLIPAWWITYIGSQVGRTVLQLTKPDDDSVGAAERLQTYDVWMIGMLAVSLVAALLAVTMVYQVTKRQSASYAAMQAAPAAEYAQPLV